jgi:hypothetical protein
MIYSAALAKLMIGIHEENKQLDELIVFQEEDFDKAINFSIDHLECS